MTEIVDTIVAGGGTAGSAAAWHLARRGAEVLLLEAHPVIDESADRAFELAYADPVYQALAAESVALWAALPSATTGVASPLLDRTGSVLHGHAPRLEAAGESLARARLAHEILSAADAESRWPGLRFAGNVLFAPEGGRLREGAAIAALRAAAVDDGARVMTGTTVTRIRILGDDLARLEVRTPVAAGSGAAPGSGAGDGAAASAASAASGGETEIGEVREIDCRRLVVTLGPSTAKLLRGLVALPRLSSTRDSSIVLPIRSGSVPAVVHLPDPSAPGQRYWRGDAAVLGGEGSVVVGWRDGATASAPSTRSNGLPARELAALLRYAREWLPGADPGLPTPISRVRTSAHHGDFVIDRIGPVIVGAGFGAAGAGLAPAIGRLLAGLADDAAAPSRFALRPDRRRAFDPSTAPGIARRA
ncbi:NAD(P)/FAD-dependent oxidoreductase [Herbiconiux ginsengi]|uniref:Sarcosine oxidase n=1 Tax=Herbiconiux ginsengi TaxID=381665 RepID=A0A1H3PIW9_9MICO|nr:FAD-dependent oxidoreductase [Herbiconiux ginsengi]SDZ00349.1 sarcosine oxidase [Herbiconiux ginsengi]